MNSSRIAAVLLTFLLAACRDTTAPDPPSETAEAIVLSIPETVVEGQAFEITVTVPIAGGTAPDADFNGTVTLSASAGTVSPASIQVTDGSGTADITLSGAAGSVSIAARSGSTTASASTMVLGHGPVARIEIVPGSILLPGSGSSRELEVRAYDAAGLPTLTAVEWTSSRPGTVAITDAGLATALAAGGSTQITASAGGVVSAPALALVAAPADDALLVSDDLVARGPEAVDANAEYGIGWRYTVELRGMDTPAVGTIILGTGESAVGGRVVSAVRDGDVVSVTLEVVTIETMFESLRISETIDLSRAPVAVPASVSGEFSVVRLPGGALEFRRRSTGTLTSRGWSHVQGGALPASDLEFTLGPFRCKIEATVAPVQLTGAATFTISPSLSFILDYDSEAGGLQRLALQGDVHAELKAEPRLESSFETKVDCGATFARITLPIGGPIALIFGGQVPLGIGFEINGKTTLANTGLRFELEADASTEIGIACAAGACAMINTFDSEASGSFEPVLPNPVEQFRVDLRIFPYGFAKLTIGNPFLTALQFETFEIRAGLAQLLDLAPTSLQVENPEYASGFRLSIFGQAKAGSKIDSFLEMLQISLVKIEARVEVPVAESPRGTITINPASVRPGSDSQTGDPATFTVTLDHASYLGFDAVNAIELFWKQSDDNGGFTLENGRPGCTTLNASSGQTTFTCQTDFLEAHVGVQTFYAFIHARLFGVPIPVPLEIASDGYASVSVGEIGNVALVSCSIFALTELQLIVVDSVTDAGVAVFNERLTDDVQCMDTETAAASQSNSDFGSYQGVSASASANGSAGVLIERGGGGRVRSITYNGAAAAEYDFNGSLTWVRDARATGSNGSNVTIRVDDVPVEYTLSGSIGQESYVRIEGPDGVIHEARNNTTAAQSVSFTGVFEPGAYYRLTGYGYQAARAVSAQDLGSGTVQFTLIVH